MGIPMLGERDWFILQLLADGHFHSGTALGKALGISRAAICQHIKQIRECGLRINAVSGRGYCLEKRLELLDEKMIGTCLSSAMQSRIALLRVLPEVDSTNSWLQRQSGSRQGLQVCLAELQSSGKGRRGRVWHSPPAANLYLSIATFLPQSVLAKGGLSLAVAVAISRVLEHAGLDRIGIKWPNDVLVGGKKIAGVLVEAAGELHGDARVIIGVGLNVAMPESVTLELDQPWTDLSREGRPLSRNQLAVMLLQELIVMLDDYTADFGQQWLDAWRKWDLTYDQPVLLSLSDKQLTGIARGIDSHGLLMLEHDGQIHSYASGDVSLRLQA